jgi:hypothetical protein
MAVKTALIWFVGIYLVTIAMFMAWHIQVCKELERQRVESVRAHLDYLHAQPWYPHR